MIEIKHISKKDINNVAELHYASFKGFFLTSLGQPFLRIFYEAILLNKNGIAIGAFYNNRLIGFAVGTNNNHGFYKSILKQHYIKMLWATLPFLLVNPLNIKRLFNSLVNSNKSNDKSTPVLLSICVSPEQESKGVGKRLLEGFEHKLATEGFTELMLTTDFHANDYVNQFYLRNSYIVVESFFQGKRKMNLYYKKL